MQNPENPENPDEPLDLDFSDLGEFELSDLSDPEEDAFAALEQVDFNEPPPPKSRELDDLDLGAYDILDVNYGANQTKEFMERFLIRVREAYMESGRGDYTCILRWPHDRVTVDHVHRFCHSVRARISRLRAELPREDRDFVIVNVRLEVLGDNQHALVTMSRMTSAIYSAHSAALVTKRNKARSSKNELLSLLR